MLTFEQFKKLAPDYVHKCPDPQAAYDYFTQACIEFEINTNLRQAHFLAQILFESNNFTALEENLNYSAHRLREVFPKRVSMQEANILAHDKRAIGNHVYNGRLGNRLGTNDGYDFRGRTPIHLTGRANYEEAAEALNLDLTTHPDVVNNPDIMFRIAGWFWHSRHLNTLADNDSGKAICRVVNGGYNGLPQRLALIKHVKSVMGI